jgi:hypothetical protein
VRRSRFCWRSSRRQVWRDSIGATCCRCRRSDAAPAHWRNFALSGQLAWTPGGYGIVFARMMEDGIVARYLEDHCPDARLRLCPYRHRLPRTADEFLWSKGPFDELGRFAGLGEEMRTIVWLGSRPSPSRWCRCVMR